MKKIDSKSEKISNIIDQLVEIDILEIDNIIFDIEDKTEIYSQARELAFKKAEQKANELADLSKINLDKPISISEKKANYSPWVQSYSNVYQTNISRENEQNFSSDSIPSGQLEIKYIVDVILEIK